MTCNGQLDPAMVIIDRHGPPAGFALLFGILLLAFAGVLLSRNVLRLPSPAPLAESVSA